MPIKPINKGFLLSTDANESEVSEQWFSPEYWQSQDAIVTTKQGRTTTWFYRHNDSVYVLKHFRRGGLVGKILSDQYLYTGLENTRVLKEFNLLQELRDKGLPAPKPEAAIVRVSGLVYRGSLITEAIPGAESVCEICQKQPLSDSQINEISTTLAKFHNAGVFHADLNINNILFDDQGKAHLIDFDRGELKQPDSSWQMNNIARLKRSFEKESGKWQSFHFSPETWEQLLATYQEALAE